MTPGNRAKAAIGLAVIAGIAALILVPWRSADPPSPPPEPRSAAPAAPAAARASADAAAAPSPPPSSPGPITVLFEFDRATLGESEAQKVDRFLSEAGAGAKRFLAAGHADRIGPAAYNQALSQRRAEAVRDYLSGKGLRADVHIEAHGERAPVTGKACMNMGPERRANRPLVRCLQPDRRVALAVPGQ